MKTGAERTESTLSGKAKEVWYCISDQSCQNHVSRAILLVILVLILVWLVWGLVPWPRG